MGKEEINNSCTTKLDSYYFIKMTNTGSLTIEELKSEKYKCSDKVLSDLKYCLSMDCTVENACLYSGITVDTYYRWLKDSEEFKLFVENARNTLFMKALSRIEEAIVGGDLKSAMWYLQKRDKRFTKDSEDFLEKDESQAKYVIEHVHLDKFTMEELDILERLTRKAQGEEDLGKLTPEQAKQIYEIINGKKETAEESV